MYLLAELATCLRTRASSRPHAWLLAAAAKAAVRGLDQDRYQQLATATAHKLAGSSTVVPQAVAEVRALQKDGYCVAVATASEEFLAREFLSLIGLASIDLVASDLELPSGVFKPHNHGQRKVESVVALTKSPVWARVYSDSASDLPLLLRAEQPILVNPGGRTMRSVDQTLDIAVTTVRWNERHI